ncbi:MAG: hypothetical protein K6F80_04515 [Oscillospiraceae bacterium]|nr:hypothetical protein [Oscillospiraceae bacterium]
MNNKTYPGQESLTRLPQTLREFGENQNRLNAELQKENASLSRQIEVLAGHLGDMMDLVRTMRKELDELKKNTTELQNEQELNIRRFHRCAEELDRMEKEAERLRLNTKLNSNAIDRLMKP